MEISKWIGFNDGVLKQLYGKPEIYIFGCTVTEWATPVAIGIIIAKNYTIGTNVRSVKDLILDGIFLRGHFINK